MTELENDGSVVIVKILNSLSYPLTVDVARQVILRKLENFFSCSCSIFFRSLMSGAKLNFDTVLTHNVPDRYHRLVQTGIIKSNNFHSFKNLDLSVVSTGAQILPHEELINEPYYKMFLKPLLLHEQLIIPLRKKKQSMGVIFLFRKEGEPAFNSKEIRTAQQMIPPLTSIIDHALMTVSTMGMSIALESLIQDLPYEGMIILNSALQPTYVSKTVEGLFFHSLDLLKNPDIFQSMLPEELLKELKQILEEEKENPKNEKKELKFDRFIFSDGSEAAITSKIFNYNKDVQLILLGLTKKEPILALSQKLKELGVSSRELDVVFLVYQGMKNIEIAQKLYISEHTVENHLRAIYHKLNVKSRTNLIHALIQMGTRSSYLIPFQDFSSF